MQLEKAMTVRQAATLLPFNGVHPVLRINDHATGGRRTKDILGGPKSLETKKLGSSKG